MTIGITSWVWIIPILLIIGVIAMKMSDEDKKKLNPFSATSIGEFIENIFGIVILAVAGSVYLLVWIAGILIVLAFVDWFSGGFIDRGVETAVATVRGEALPKRPGADCDFNEKLDDRGNKIGNDWMSATICKNDKQFMFFMPKGQRPEVQYRDTDDVVVNTRDIASFIQIEGTWGKPGGMPNLYRLYVQPGQNGFAQAGIDSITIAIRASDNRPKETTKSETRKASEAQCTGIYADLKGCKSITFKSNQTYTRSAKPNECLVADPHELVKSTSLGNDEYRYTSYRTGSTVKFFDLPIGETFYTFTCRP